MLDLAKFDKSEFDILVAKCGKTIGLKGEVKLIIYSDFLEVFTKGNVFLCKGTNSSRGDFSQLHSPRFLDEPSVLSASLASRRHKNSSTILEFASCKNAESKRDSSPTAQNDNLGGKSVEISSDSAFFLTLQSFNPHKNSATFAEITSIDCAKNLTSMLLFSTKSLTQKQCALGENEHFWFEIIGRSVVENGENIGVVSEIERIGSVDYLIISVDSAVFAKYPHIKAKRFYLPYISRYVLGAKNGIVAVQDALLVLESS